jgi:hypothetical protein
MTREAVRMWQSLKKRVLDESGQAVTEYVSITTLFMFSTLALGASYPYSKLVIQALQAYINFYFFSLNLAVG